MKRRIRLGDFVWYLGKAHVVLHHNPVFIELVRFGDRSKRTFWTLRLFTRDFTLEELNRLRGK